MSQDRVLAYLHARGRVAPPPEFVGTVMVAVADSVQDRRSRFALLLPAAAAVGIAAAAITALFLVGQDPPVGPSPAPSTSVEPGADLTEVGNVVVKPAVDEDGEWGTVRLERGAEVPVPRDESLFRSGSFAVLIRVTYTATRDAGSVAGASDFGLRVDGTVPDLTGAEEFFPARRGTPPGGDHLQTRLSVTEGSTIDGWILLEVPMAATEFPNYLVFAPRTDVPGPVTPAWEVLVRAAHRPLPSASLEPEPIGDADLLEPGNSVMLPIQSVDGAEGTITIERGEDVGGYPLVLDPSSETHFFIEMLATYGMDVSPETAQWGDLDWRVEGADHADLGAELLQSFPEPEGRGSLGTWPGATVPEDRYQGWLIFAVPREAADQALDLIYRPPGVTGETRFPLRLPDDAPTPVAAEWPRPDPTYVAREGLPFTVLDTDEADALFADADTCTNPDDGYTVQYPDSWYTNTALDNVPACSWFSPTFFELNESGDRPEEIAIEITVFEGAVGFIWADLYSEQITLDGFSARRAETGMTKDAQMPTDTFTYYYLVLLDADSEGRKLWGFTGTDYGGDYELNRAVFDRIMASLEFTGDQ